jgi:DNA-directed RNA polymerase beta' subunit
MKDNLLGLYSGGIGSTKDVVISDKLESKLSVQQLTNGIENPNSLSQKPKVIKDRKEAFEYRSNVIRQRANLKPYVLDSFIYSYFSTKEIDALAKVNCTSPEKDGVNSARDLRMGPQNNNQLCDTCSSTIDECSGHYGKIDCPPMFSPLALQPIIYLLTIFCHKCGHLLITDEEIAENGFDKLSATKRLAAMANFVSKNDKKCKRKVMVQNKLQDCKGANQPVPNYLSLKDKKSYILYYKFGVSGTEFPTTPSAALKIFDAIPDSEAIKVGFRASSSNPTKPISHPRNLIIERILVMPYNARPDLMNAEKPFPSEFTNVYIEIIKLVRDYKNATASADERSKIMEHLWYRYHNLIKSKPQGSSAKKDTSDIHKSINGKKGIIRACIMGKRVNSAGRSVAAPGYNIRVDELGVAKEMAQKLTVPVVATVYNKESLQRHLEAGNVVYITPKNGRNAGQRINISNSQQKLKYEVQVGDKIERYLMNGDRVIVNRQPTLKRQSMTGLRATIIEPRVLRINLSLTTPLGADFDGDEINSHVPQTTEAIAETAITLGVANNLINEENNRAMMAIVYDGLTAAYKLTYDPIEVSLRQECAYVKQQMQYNMIPRDRSDEEVDREYSELIKEHKLKKKNADIDYLTIQNEIIEYYETHSNVSEDDPDFKKLINRQREIEQLIGLVDVNLFNLCMDVLKDTEQYATLADRAQKHNVPWQTGRIIFSASLPENFYYNNNGVVIVDGILKSGTIDSSTIGHGENSIIVEMIKQYDGQTTVDFMSNIQFILNEYFAQVGFTVGYDDLVPDNYSKYMEMINMRRREAEIKVIGLQQEVKHNKIEEEKKEMNIRQTLDIVKAVGDSLTSSSTNPSKNAFLMMNKSGAKGSNTNFAQISAILAQQMIGGYRIPADLPGNRTLPVFEVGDLNPRSRGFVDKSYLTGLDATSSFFHSTSTREGITDTALGTAKTGAVAHILGKVLEDIHITAQGAVGSTDGSILSPIYGEDGFSAGAISRMRIRNHIGSEDGKKGMILFFRDLQQVAGKINAKYGYMPY